jgi:soluble lytic murein transglycosylase-like protein
MPGTAKGFGVTNVFDIKQNLDASLKLISGHLRKYEGRDPWDQLSLALACYNAGPGAVKKYGGVPPYRETTNYIRKITDLYLKLTGLK